MKKINHLAENLNAALDKEDAHLSDFLSDYGSNTYFPKEGILGQTAEAKGTRINATIGQAFEDDGRPMILPALLDASKSLSPAETFLYSPSYGQAELRQLWQKAILAKNPSIKSRISLPVVVSGLTNGLSLVSRLFVENGGNVILPKPFWDNYDLIFNQARFQFYPLFGESGFNLKGLEEKLEEEGASKVLLFNFPNNPTGYTPTESEAAHMAEMVKHYADCGNKILAICDDAYFGLTYEEEAMKESIFSKFADLHRSVLAIKVDGATKEMYTWGLRTAFVTYGTKDMTAESASALEDKAAGAAREVISNACTASQHILIKGLKSEEASRQMRDNYSKLKERYGAVKETLERNPNYSEFFEALPFNSGYFMCAELKGKTPEETQEVRRRLVREHSTGVIALGSLIRVAYSSVGKGKIPELFDNLYKACKE